MATPKNALQLALGKGTLKTRPIEEIARDQKETLLWAEEVAKNFPVKVRRGRPSKEAAEPSGPSRSVTVRFPPAQVKVILACAQHSGFTLSEFVRAAAFQVAAKGAAPRPAAKAAVKTRRGPVAKGR